MKKIFSFLLLLMLFTEAFSQKQEFGAISYVVPPGYTTTKNNDVLTYYRQNDKAGFCVFFIYSLTKAAGNTKECFDYYWENLVQNPNNITAIPDMQKEAETKGWHFLMGSAKFDQKGVPVMAMQITFTGGDEMQNVVILSNSSSYQKNIEDFIASADMLKNAGAATKKPQQSSAATGNIKYEVWMCNCFSVDGSMGDKTFTGFLISPDNKCLYYMPEKGLNGVTPQNSNTTGSWGNVTDKGNMLELRNDKYGSKKMYKISATSLSQDNSKYAIYKKVRQVDGLRFEGAYSPEVAYYTGKTDIISRQTDPNKRPIIFFKKDGTYIDEGIEFSNLTFGDPYALGRGTYEIVNYSLILNTASGKKLQIAFIPVLDANPSAADNPGFMINGRLYYRLGKDYVPHN